VIHRSLKKDFDFSIHRFPACAGNDAKGTSSLRGFKTGLLRCARNDDDGRSTALFGASDDFAEIALQRPRDFEQGEQCRLDFSCLHLADRRAVQPGTPGDQKFLYQCFEDMQDGHFKIMSALGRLQKFLVNTNEEA
jgi:hypothetical protein